MIPSKLPTLNIYRGDNETFSLLFTLSDGSPYDLRVWSDIRCQIRGTYSYKSYLIADLNLIDGSITIEGDGFNRLTFHLNGVDTNKFTESKKYYSDIRFIDGNGEIKTLLTREVIVNLNVTENN